MKHGELLEVTGDLIFNGVSLFGLLVCIYRSRLKGFLWGSKPQPFSHFFYGKTDPVTDIHRHPIVFTAATTNLLHLSSFKKDWKLTFNQVALDLAGLSNKKARSSVPPERVINYRALLSVLQYFERTDEINGDVPIDALYAIGFDFADLANYLESYGCRTHSNSNFPFDRRSIVEMLRMHFGNPNSGALHVGQLFKAMGISVHSLLGFFPSELPKIPLEATIPLAPFDLGFTFCQQKMIGKGREARDKAFLVEQLEQRGGDATNWAEVHYHGVAEWDSAQVLYELDCGQGRALAVADEKNNERFVIDLDPAHDQFNAFVNEGPLSGLGHAFKQYNIVRQLQHQPPVTFWEYIKVIHGNQGLFRFPKAPPAVAAPTAGNVTTENARPGPNKQDPEQSW